MKKFAALLLAAATTLSMAVPAFAATPSVYLNGEKMTFETDPYIKDDRILVPMRAIFDACNATLQWDQSKLTVIGVKNNVDEEGQTGVSTIVLQINNPLVFIDSQPIEIDVPAEVTNDRTFVPLRVISEALGAEVEWNAEELRVDITITK